VSITLPNGVKVMGDEIRMTEQVKAAGGYSYTTFDGLVFYGTFAGGRKAHLSADLEHGHDRARLRPPRSTPTSARSWSFVESL
jgi:hypothetical protein